MFLRGREIVMDLIVFDMLDFDITLSMAFFSQYEVKIYYKKMEVWFWLDDRKEFTFGKRSCLEYDG